MANIFCQAPFLRLSLFYISGILIAFHGNIPPWIFTVCGLFSIVILMLSFLPFFKESYLFRWTFGMGIFFLCFSTAGFFTQKHESLSEWKGTDEMQTYVVEIIDEPVRKAKTFKCTVKVNQQKAIIYVTADSLSEQLTFGDRVQIQARFTPPEYDYWRKKGIAATAFVYRDNWEKQDRNTAFNLKYQSLHFRKKLLKQLRVIIADEESFLIAAALVTGYQEELTPEILRTFAATGTSHVLSVSGLHFSIIYSILYYLFSFLGNNRQSKVIRQSIILPIMWAFAFLTGLPPSVVRSVSMLSLWGIASTFHFRAFTMNTLSTAAFFMLLYNPFYLFDISFQLSFLAVFSILTIYPLLSELYISRKPLINYVWQLSCVSTSAQIGTSPLSIYYFNQFPTIYLLANLFIIPITGLLLLLVPVSLLISFVFPDFSLLKIPTNMLLNFVLSGLNYLESIPGGMIENIRFTAWDSLWMSLIFFFLIMLFLKKRIFYLYLFLILVCVQVFYYFC